MFYVLFILLMKEILFSKERDVEFVELFRIFESIKIISSPNSNTVKVETSHILLFSMLSNIKRI